MNEMHTMHIAFSNKTQKYPFCEFLRQEPGGAHTDDFFINGKNLFFCITPYPFFENCLVSIN